MNQEKVIELAEKHGATSYRNRADTENPAYGFTGAQLEALISEVEQATLERAAQECETISDCYWSGDGATAASSCAGNIRNLAKDAQ